MHKILSISSERINLIEKFSNDLQIEEEKLTVCQEVADFCYQQFGWISEYGIYDGPAVRKRGVRRYQYCHHYNRLPDGTIIDSTAKQFKYDTNVLVIPINHHCQKHYITIVSQHNNKIQESHYGWNEKHPIVRWYEDYLKIKTINLKT